MNLNLPVTSLPKVGPAYEKRLSKLHIETVEDLLFHFPFRYNDFSNIKNTTDIFIGETVTLIGKLTSIKNIYTKHTKKLTEAILTDTQGSISIIWFNQHFLSRTLTPGMDIALSGKVDEFGNKLVLLSPEYEILKEKQLPTHTGGIIPVYPETTKLSSKWLRAKIKPILNNVSLTEMLPQDILEQEQFEEITKSLKAIHFPKTQQEADKARRRFAYQELFLLQLQNLQNKHLWSKDRRSPSLTINEGSIQTFKNNLPFNLTSAQERAIKEIFRDIKQEIPMNRLLEGDVGSGKTVVACLAAYATHQNKYQTILMAPTEVLALQHFETVRNILNPYGISCALLTGNKKQVTTEANIFIGTHALFHQKELFTRAGLVIIDEQHRFGVEQRALLNELAQDKKQKLFPHILTMTATPIPRTLALTIYGDLDLSVIDEMPKDRKRVKTFVTPAHKREKAYQWIQNKIIESEFSEQAFIIYPLIEESDHETMKDIKAATKEFESLQNSFPKLKLGLLHGRLKSKEKEEILQQFQNKKINILIATSVVEVGIDIPSATVMIIENAERFGLSQLHQLRGRIGRSTIESFCFLFTQARSELALERLHALEKLHNGHDLAEIDLKLRGPGEVFGTKQHGLPDLKIASYTDIPLLKKTQQAAKSIWEKNKILDHYPALRDTLKTRNQKYVTSN